MASHIERRKFLATLGGAAAAWPLAARGQQLDRVQQVSVLMGPAESDPEAQSEVVAFRQGLQKLGWTGRNVRIAYANRMRTLARELVALQPDAIFAAAFWRPDCSGPQSHNSICCPVFGFGTLIIVVTPAAKVVNLASRLHPVADRVRSGGR
jgi:hypothetical protein